MSTPRPRMRSTALRGAIGVALLLIGLLCLGLWRVFSGTENLVFADGAGNPPPAHVTEGDTYSIAVPGGARSFDAHTAYGQSSGALPLSCTWTAHGALSQTLTVEPENVDTKAETTIGRFTAPITGEIAVRCATWGNVFVPDADDVGSDTSGYFLVAAVVVLTVGVALSLSAARSASLASRGPSEDEQIERLVDLGSLRTGDDEVAGDDVRDVPQ